MIKITVNDVEHILETLKDNTPDFAGYSNSINTQNALQTAYDRGDWQPYTPPEPEPEQPEPDWQGFRMALLQSATFRAWSEGLPATWREDLKLSAIAANPEALQSVYDYLAGQWPPEQTAAAAWQSIATENHIPVGFSDA